MRIVTAKHCAWRGFYVYGHDRRGSCPGEALRFAVTIDPRDGVKPHMTIQVGWQRDCTGGRKARWRFTIPMPWVQFRHPANAVQRGLYRLSAGFWHRFDGRRGAATTNGGS